MSAEAGRRNDDSWAIQGLFLESLKRFLYVFRFIFFNLVFRRIFLWFLWYFSFIFLFSPCTSRLVSLDVQLCGDTHTLAHSLWSGKWPRRWSSGASRCVPFPWLPSIIIWRRRRRRTSSRLGAHNPSSGFRFVCACAAHSASIFHDRRRRWGFMAMEWKKKYVENGGDAMEMEMEPTSCCYLVVRDFVFIWKVGVFA